MPAITVSTDNLFDHSIKHQFHEIFLIKVNEILMNHPLSDNRIRNVTYNVYAIDIRSVSANYFKDIFLQSINRIGSLYREY